MWPLQDEWQVHERQRDLLSQAQQQHQIALALAGEPQRTARYAPLLRWLGQHLSAWGTQLETRYQPKPARSRASNV